MKKMLKIMAMLLVISAVVFAAGCSDKNADTTAEDGSQEEVTDQAPVADENGTQTEDVAAEVPADNITDDDFATDNMTVEDNDSADDMTVEDNDSADDNMTVEDNDSADDNVTVEDNDSADDNATQTV
ncbi:hypothetical protein MSBRW_3042 [Methanosarcina barkeri str. Wiesmoor]|uniref:Uncharacterized protein n=2 Tax=Methanosarcina barkeri TaxID=2208 RepID=A0A0E3QMJ2_METBA|nr:hypothetical protein [Methanosarcina barkeri]AKB52295.1 hypothetical protein MSBRW_3042 [Methanosarcina barkeri str. Wiesmoor]